MRNGEKRGQRVRRYRERGRERERKKGRGSERRGEVEKIREWERKGKR